MEAKTRVKPAKGNDGPAAGVAVPVAFQEAGVYGGLVASQVQTEGGMSHEARPVQDHVQEAALQRVQRQGIDPAAAISPQTGCRKTEGRKTRPG